MIVICGISTLEFAETQKIVQNQKNQIWDRKCFIWVFWAVSLRKYCHISSQHPRICQNAKFRAKLKIFRLQF